MKVKGILIPIGGNEDKGIEISEIYHLEFILDGILSRVVKESGGTNASIIIIPTASSIPAEVGENYLAAFSKLGCTNLHVMDIREREQSDDPANLELMKKADCVMFSGGDQSNITKKIGGTKLHKIMSEKYTNEPFVIAGTSAGAMCMSKEMITGGGIKEAFTKGATRMGEGMSFIPELIIDSHFIRRGRFGRLAEAVAKFPKIIGIGLAEDTGLIIKGNKFEVIGSGMVIVFNARKAKHNNRKVIKEGDAMSLTNLKTHILANGDRFNIEKKSILVSPLSADLV
ncbi:cyanophycinase [Ulvibacter litoralis]|uniref:Cyanophycinase n=1 Tax=Ulvibacter litoralis TaxID=227084 RepID=A0A1G7DRH1_9FLAO|nr:cyanophycinase [Ulvibacter litoralis]GHC42570.1 cyanophycinase [Ulvibacter litoralis]SDE54097.1 cyanophycinase [Ulvibacter litoralis]